MKLLIIDEVHLLNEDRGAVIETIVARTLRQVHKRLESHHYVANAMKSGRVHTIIDKSSGA